MFNFRYARPGDGFELVQDETGAIVSFDYRQSRLERYTLSRRDDALVAERIQPDLVRKTARLAGVVTTSLYETIASLGEKPELAHDFSEIFAWDVDFARAVQPGDEFSIYYERNYLQQDGEEHYSGPGRILAARYSNAEADHTAFYYQPEESAGGYYRYDGSSVERQFLRAPLKYKRISSRYSPNRLHPILKVRRPHLGIDYAAPRGTPVWAVADGQIVFRGRQGGFGNLVKVRHTNGYVSYYGHLASFERGLHVGDRVQQKQLLGYVGSTGLSTGPHLDFRLKHHGRYVNPASLQTPAGDPIPAERMAGFKATRDDLIGALDPTPMVAGTSEAL